MTEYKGFDPSFKKLREARKKGKVVKSPILSQALAFCVVLLCVFNGLTDLWLKNLQMLEWCLSVPYERLGVCSMQIGQQVLWVILGSLVAGVFAVIFAEVVQVRFEFLWDPIGPQIERVNPVAGLKRIGQGLKKSWLLVLKIVLVLVLAWYAVLDMIPLAQAAFLLPTWQQVTLLFPQLAQLVYTSAALLLVFGGVEYLYNRNRFMKEQSMSLDEVRREYKDEEGDPHMKSHRKALHESMITQELVKRVRESKVIIVD